MKVSATVWSKQLENPFFWLFLVSFYTQAGYISRIPTNRYESRYQESQREKNIYN
jgi:hypothetical protein